MNTLQTLLIFLIIFIVAMLLCWLATGSPPFVRQRRRTEENTLPKKASSDVRVIKTKNSIIIEFLVFITRTSDDAFLGRVFSSVLLLCLTNGGEPVASQQSNIATIKIIKNISNVCSVFILISFAICRTSTALFTKKEIIVSILF